MASSLPALARPGPFAGLAIAALVFAAWTALLSFGLGRYVPALHGVSWLPLLVLGQCFLDSGLFITAHDAMHGTLLPAHPRANDALGQLALLLFACFPYGRLRQKHHAHHASPGREEDPDGWLPGRPGFLRWLLRFLGQYVSPLQLCGMGGVATGLWLLGVPLWKLLLLWAVPAWLSALQLFTFGTWLPHRPGTAFADEHRARSTRLPVWLSFLSCFHFGGFHHEHHLFPGVPWWRLPRLRRHVEAG